MIRKLYATLILALLATIAIPAAAQYGNQPQYFPMTGGQKVEQTASRKLVDTFNNTTSLDTAVLWSTLNAGAGSSTTYTQGQEQLISGTATGGFALLSSQTAFQVNSPAFLLYRAAPNAQVTETANTCKEYGFFVAATTPTCAAPVTDGILFEITIAGKLQAVTYASGTRTLIADLSVPTGVTWQPIFNPDGSVLCPGRQTPQPSDTCPHIMDIWFNGNSAEFDIDGKAVAFMLSGSLGPNNNQLPWSAMAINAGSAVGTTLKINQAAVGDESKFTSADPCTYVQKASSPISITTAATSGIVANSGSLAKVFVCGVALTIAPSATTADTIQFEQGVGGTCASSPVALTGTFGNGDLTSATGVAVLNFGAGNSTVFSTAAGNSLCAVSAGTAVNIQGVITYVQQ